MTSCGAFEWIRRMGVHEAYHLDRTNRLIHWICIPIEIAAVLKLAALVPGPIDVAGALIVAVGALYLAADVLAGALMIALLVLLRALVLPWTTGSPALDAVVATVALVAAFTFQTRIGHGVFERGVDDTAMNLAELARTKNPIPTLLIFAYHGFELLFALGYRPALREAVERHRAAELMRMRDDVRRPARSAPAREPPADPGR
jgi:uncharacterized membrane protein YGL010W